MRLDLHNHTWYSHDGDLSPRALLETAARRGIDWLGVTDHETLRGGLLEMLRVARPGSAASRSALAVRWVSLLRSAAQKRLRRRGVVAGRMG